MNRLATRIFVAFFLILVLTSVGAIGITRWFLAERQAATERYTIAQAEAAALALADGGRSGLTEWLRTRPTETGVFVVDEWGDELLGRQVPPPFGPSPAMSNAEPDALASPEVLLRLPQRMPVLVSADDERFRVIVLPARSGMGRPDAWSTPVVLIGLLALISTALVSFWLARSITQPIETLERAADQWSTGRLDTRISAVLAARRDELGRLGRTFDTMARRLAELVASRERLLREVSHELRSPLARMRVALGLLRQTGRHTPDEVERLETEIERLDGLIGTLLDLSRLDADPAALAREPIDLATLADQVAQDATFEAQSLGCRIAWHGPSTPCPIKGDPHWVSAALENVLRNAIHHAPLGSTVDFLLEQTGDGYAQVRIRDSGPGVPESELSRVFEPFHRVALPSRDGGSPGGVGLGLAIAARVVTAHGGEIVARLRAPETGLEVQMRWPLG